MAGLCLWAAACTVHRTPEVTRTLAGSPTRGHFVPPYAYEMYLRGELYLQKGEPERAAAYLEQALSAPELDPYVLARLALALHRAGLTERARARLAEADELTPCPAEAWLVRGTIAAEAGDLRAALAAHGHALQCNPGHTEAARARLAILVELGAEVRAETLAALDETPALLPPRAREAALRRALEAGELEHMRELLPPEEVDPTLPWALRARVLARLGDVQGAARAWRKAAPLHDDDLIDAATCLARAGAWPEASMAAEAALATNPGPAESLHLRKLNARALRAQGNLPGALAALPADDATVVSHWLEGAALRGLAAELTRAEMPAGAGTTQ